MPRKSKSKKGSKKNKKWESKSKNSKPTLLPASDCVNHEELLIRQLMHWAEDVEITSSDDDDNSTPEPQHVVDNAANVEDDAKSPVSSESTSMAPTEVNIKSFDDSDSDHYSDCEPEEYKLCLECGRGVNIVSSCGREQEGQQFRLNALALTQLLERAGSRPVALVSVAGAYRGGKSFLLDFMLRYLYAQASGGSAGEDWLGGEEEPLRGFSWRGGCERDTAGLVLWSQPIPVTLPTGEEVVVLLMDTQGSFDDQSSLRDCSLVFALSTLLSSVQIYNISQNIKEHDLQHLQLFTEYAAQGGGGLAALRLLLRDWSAPYEFPYGAAGGERYLRHKLQVKEEQPQELRDIRQRLAASFESMSCFLLPHPGLQAASDPHFQGKLSELSAKFKQSLRELVPLVLAPENLREKTIGGKPLTARELPVLLQAYLDEFNTRVPTPRTILSATARAAWMCGREAARAALCDALPAHALSRASLRARLAAAANDARAPLPALAHSADDLDGLERFDEEMEASVERYIKMNDDKIKLAVAEARDVFENAVRELEDGNLCLHPLDLTVAIAEARDAAVAYLNCNFECDAAEPERVQLETDLEARSSVVLLRLSGANAAGNRAALEAACAALARALPRGCAHAADLAAAHAAAAARAVSAFHQHRNRPTAHQHDEYVDELQHRIELCLRKREEQNFISNRNAKNDALRIYESSINFNNGCWRPGLLAAKHVEIEDLVLETFYNKREGPNSRERDEFVEQIESVLSSRYDDLSAENELKNGAAVNDTFKKFCATMDTFCVGFRVEDSELQAKLDSAFAKGKDEFMQKRVRGPYRSFDEDPYFDLLQQKMRDRCAHYRRVNSGKLSGSEVAESAAVVGGAALVALASPRYGLPALFAAVVAAFNKKPGSG